MQTLDFKVRPPTKRPGLVRRDGVLETLQSMSSVPNIVVHAPPGYGKTTLMEYVANRLGVIFMKINGPALGHEERSLDPAPALTNAALFARDGHLCLYCGQQYSRFQLTRDHVMPLSRGGRDIWVNVVSACVACNLKKSNRTPQQAGMPLLPDYLEEGLERLGYSVEDAEEITRAGNEHRKFIPTNVYPASDATTILFWQRPFFALQLWSHKVLRYLVPEVLAAVAVGNLVMVAAGFAIWNLGCAPMVTLVDMINFSRSGSIGGLVTCANFCRK